MLINFEIFVSKAISTMKKNMIALTSLQLIVEVLVPRMERMDLLAMINMMCVENTITMYL